MAALRAYRKPASDQPGDGNRIEPGILCAVNRWLSNGDVRIEFYSANASGEIRVKIIDEDGVKACDLSLTSFLSSSPKAN
jgi:hypothetical protein